MERLKQGLMDFFSFGSKAPEQVQNDHRLEGEKTTTTMTSAFTTTIAQEEETKNSSHPNENVK